MECIFRKANANVIVRMHHVWRKGQKEPFGFHKNLNWYVLESGRNIRMFSDVYINILCDNNAHLTDDAYFDLKSTRFSCAYEIFLINYK